MPRTAVFLNSPVLQHQSWTSKSIRDTNQSQEKCFQQSTDFKRKTAGHFLEGKRHLYEVFVFLLIICAQIKARSGSDKTAF